MVASDLNCALAGVAGCRICCRVSSGMLGSSSAGGNTTISACAADLATASGSPASFCPRRDPRRHRPQLRATTGVPERNIRVDCRKAADLDLRKDVAAPCAR
jgi:hypothetical protein